MFERIAEIEARYQELEDGLGRPELARDPVKLRELSQKKQRHTPHKPCGGKFPSHSAATVPQNGLGLFVDIPGIAPFPFEKRRHSFYHGGQPDRVRILALNSLGEEAVSL